MKTLCKSEHWSRFDRKIRDAEAEELRRLNANEDLMEEYFDAKRKKELSEKTIKEMSWDNIHHLNEIRKNAVENQEPNPEELQQEILTVAKQCQIMASKNRPDLLPAFGKLRKLLEKSQENNNHIPRDSAASEEEIADQAPVSVSKGLTIRKFPSKNIVSGWSSVQNIDHAGDVMPAEEFAQILQKFFMEDGKICLQHETGNIIGKLRSFEVKKHANGRNGIYVHTEITDQNVIKAIEKGALTGFSWHFRASRKKECAKNECYNKLQPDSVVELSIVDFPCEPNAKIESLGSQA